MGGLLIVLAALGTFLAYTSATTGPTRTIVVAERALAAGERITAGDVRTVAVDMPDGVHDTLFGSVTDLDGAVALSAIDLDQAIPRRAVSRGVPTDGFRAHDLSFALERPRALNGQVQPGELVDLVATYGSGADATTLVVARRVPVVTIDTRSGSAVGSSAEVTLTIALDSEEAVLQAAHALEVANVTLTRATGTDAGTPPAAPFTSPGTVAGTDDGGRAP